MFTYMPNCIVMFSTLFLWTIITLMFTRVLNNCISYCSPFFNSFLFLFFLCIFTITLYFVIIIPYKNRHSLGVAYFPCIKKLEQDIEHDIDPHIKQHIDSQIQRQLDQRLNSSNLIV